MNRKRTIGINLIILGVGLVVAELIPVLMCRNTRHAPDSIRVWLSQPFIFLQTARQAFVFCGIIITTIGLALAISLIWIKARWLSYVVTTLCMVSWWLALWGAIIAGMIG
jgi:hypothetical protein